MNEKTYLSIEEIVSLPTVSGTNISEDGKNVAFVKKTANWKDNTYSNHVWIYEKEKGQSYSLTRDIDSTYPLWSPNSSNIGYLSPVGDDRKNQIFVKSIDGDSGGQITDVKEGVSNFKWEPTGKGFYYISQSKESERIKKRKEQYGEFQHIGKDYRNDCLYYIEIENRVVYQLTDDKDFHIHDFDISKMEKRLY